MAPPFDLSWTPELENKLSTQIDGQLPDFISEDHPQFAKFIKSYYQFLESAELQLTVSIDNIILEVQTPTNLLLEDGTLLVTESGAGSTGKFVKGETITGGTSYATAKVLAEDLGNATPRLFISSQQRFQTDETVTGGTSGATGSIIKYRANPVQNIQQLLANANIDNTIDDFIEEFRKSFMSGIPANIANGINKRNLEKHINELYRRKGTDEGIKLFIKILLGEEAEIFYPNQYMTKPSAADWDKPTIIRVSSPDDIDADELIGQSITGNSSLATALVENSTTFSLSGGTSYIEFEISSVVGTFENGETAYGRSGKGDVRFNFIINQIISSASISNDGTLYSVDDVIDLDSSVAIGSGDVSAVVGTIQRGSVSGVIIDNAGSNYEIGELVVFEKNSSEDGEVQEALGVVTSTNGLIVSEEDTADNVIIQESGTNTFEEQFNFQLEEGTLIAEEPFAVFGTDRIYSGGAGYYYPIYITNYAAEQTTISKSSARVKGETFNSTAVVLDGNAGDDIVIGMVVRSNSISGKVTVTSVTDQSNIILSIPQKFSDNEVLTFDSLAKAVREYKFVEYPGLTFYSPTATTVAAAGTYDVSTYTLYGGDFAYQSDHLYNESGNVASYSDGINTELELGHRIQSEWAVSTLSFDTNRSDNDGFVLESGAGDITKISVTEPGDGYGLLPTVTVRTRYGNGANVLATTTDIGRIDSINITNPGFSYTESPTAEARANFIIKDITGIFAVGDTLTSHTGTIRSYDSTTQLLEVSIEDSVAIESESVSLTSNEGMRLEEGVNREIRLETSGNILLDGTDGSSTNAGDSIVLNGTDSFSSDADGQLIIEESDDGLLLLDGTDSDSANDGDNIIGETEIISNEYVDDNFILDADLVYGENLVDEDGDRILLNATAATTDFILLEDGQGELIMEFPEIVELAQTLLEDDSGSIRAEPDVNGIRHFICQEDGYHNDSIVYDYELRHVKFIQESAPSIILSVNSEDFILLNADIEYEDNLVINQTNLSATILLENEEPTVAQIILEDGTPDGGGGANGNDAILLDGTNSDGEDENDKLFLELASADTEPFYNTDAILLDGTNSAGEDENDKLFFEEGIPGPANIGEKIVFNATDANGTNDPSDLIVLESGVTDVFGIDDVNNKLLYENDVAFTNLVLDGTNASSLHATDKILFEDAGFDFSAGTTSITTATASATIAHADIAKLSFNLGTSTEKFGKFSGIEHLISEQLIRLQDSYYYQDFSYEVQTSSSGNIYLNELKKAVHPAGFNVFAKTLIVSLVSAKAKVAVKPSEEGTIVFRFNNTIHKFSDVTNTDDYYSYTWDAPRVRNTSYT